MTTRADSKQADILDAIVQRLVSTVDKLAFENCYVSIIPDGAPYRAIDDIWVTVSPGAGRFEGIEGGGQNQCTEYFGVLITIFSRFRANRQEHDQPALADETRGLLSIKRRILQSLVDHDLAVNGVPGLRNLLIPTDAGPPDPAPNTVDTIQLTLRFEVAFDWDLT